MICEIRILLYDIVQGAQAIVGHGMVIVVFPAGSRRPMRILRVSRKQACMTSTSLHAWEIWLQFQQAQC